MFLGLEDIPSWRLWKAALRTRFKKPSFFEKLGFCSNMSLQRQAELLALTGRQLAPHAAPLGIADQIIHGLPDAEDLWLRVQRGQDHLVAVWRPID